MANKPKRNPYCKECQQEAILITGIEKYPHRPDLAHIFVWQCSGCKASVGCHPGTQRALGTLASDELKRLRRSAHYHFDKLWRSKEMTRKAAYSWLSEQLDIPFQQTHIGQFNMYQCQKTINAVLNRNGELEEFM